MIERADSNGDGQITPEDRRKTRRLTADGGPLGRLTAAPRGPNGGPWIHGNFCVPRERWDLGPKNPSKGNTVSDVSGFEVPMF